MKLSPPQNTTWIIAVILGVVGILSAFIIVPFFSTYTFLFVTAGFILLALGTLLEGL